MFSLLVSVFFTGQWLVSFFIIVLWAQYAVGILIFPSRYLVGSFAFVKIFSCPISMCPFLAACFPDDATQTHVLRKSTTFWISTLKLWKAETNIFFLLRPLHNFQSFQIIFSPPLIDRRWKLAFSYNSFNTWTIANGMSTTFSHSLSKQLRYTLSSFSSNAGMLRGTRDATWHNKTNGATS